ncbi:MAG: putative Peptidoglycan glycosyltransferase [Candidatus Saccharibacteria bacterium]|nr:putative Peptidoglycan glycosyltransferase [Candidatus Saccharibacteria bacterium]
MAPKTETVNPAHAVRRVRLWYSLVIVIIAVFGLRLFYIQVIRYDYYRDAALSDQLKQYQIPATRGIIKAHNGDTVVPIVLNQKLYTLFANPAFIKDVDKYADAVTKIIGGQPSDYTAQLKKKGTQYAVLGKKLTEEQSKAVAALKLPGLGTEEQQYRTYPQQQLASQLLGFVNNDGVGKYGIEQALNKELSGTPGELKAITDVHGVPLAASKDNIQKAAQPGKNVVLTIDLAMQAQMEKALQQRAQSTKSELLSAVIMDPNTGAIKAMANYPTYNPAKINDVEDPSVFQNAVVTHAIEPGSIMKVLTTAAALDQGVIKPNTSWYDPAQWTVNGYTITNIEEDGGARTQTVASTLALSLNTGVTWELMQMGGGQINAQAIAAWHSYMADHYLFGKETGVEQGYEGAGYVPGANPKKPAIALTYANSSFGQGVTITAMQAAAALSGVVNGGTYYQPTLVDQTINADGTTTKQQPKVLKKGVVSAQTSQAMLPLMEQVVDHYRSTGFTFMKFGEEYMVGGKTGTAQIAQPGGGYSDNDFNGTYMGFVGGDQPQYVIAVFNNKPKVNGYAGSQAGQPVFADLAHMLINNGFVTPKN